VAQILLALCPPVAQLKLIHPMFSDQAYPSQSPVAGFIETL